MEGDGQAVGKLDAVAADVGRREELQRALNSLEGSKRQLEGEGRSRNVKDGHMG